MPLLSMGFWEMETTEMIWTLAEAPASSVADIPVLTGFGVSTQDDRTL